MEYSVVFVINCLISREATKYRTEEPQRAEKAKHRTFLVTERSRSARPHTNLFQKYI